MPKTKTMTLPVCAPQKRKEFEKSPLIHEKDGIEIYGTSNPDSIPCRFRMYKGEYLLAELFSVRAFENQYNRDFNRWIAAVKRKDIAKAKKFKEAAAVALVECELIENIWED